MNSLSGLVASYLVNSLWEVALIAGAGWMTSRAVRRLGPAAEHAYWVFSLIVALLTPMFSIVGSLIAGLHLSSVLGGSASVILMTGQRGVMPHSLSTQLGRIALPLTLLYAALIVFATGRLIVSLYNTLQLLRATAPIVLRAEQQEAWCRCQQSFGLTEVSLRSCEGISGPVTLGIFRSVLLMPARFFSECATEDLFAALAHECAHIRRRDFQKNLFYELLSLPLALHPGMWLIKSRITRTRELICDRMATATLIDSRQYTRSLLRLAAMVFASTRRPLLNAIGIFDANILEERLAMIRTTQRIPNSFTKYGVLTPAVLMLLCVAGGGATMAIAVEPQSTAQAGSGPVYNIGKDVSVPTLIFSKDPEYPESARKGEGVQGGSCIVALTVDTSGTPRNVHITRTLAKEFDANAIKAVEQYRFKPAVRAGQPVSAALTVEVNYQRF